MSFDELPLAHEGPLQLTLGPLQAVQEDLSELNPRRIDSGVTGLDAVQLLLDRRFRLLLFLTFVRERGDSLLVCSSAEMWNRISARRSRY
ncbi:hypothetical protein ACFQ3Z_15735 [Streptomyces nogalater]